MDILNACLWESLGVIVFYHMGIMENALVVITTFRLEKKKKKSGFEKK